MTLSGDKFNMNIDLNITRITDITGYMPSCPTQEKNETPQMHNSASRTGAQTRKLLQKVETNFQMTRGNERSGLYAKT